MIAIDLKPNEPLHIGDNIVVVVVEFKKSQVRLGIDAPLELAIERDDTKERK